MYPKTIYLDLDGVLCDFLGGLLWYHNRNDLLVRYNQGEFPLDWELEGELGSMDELWKPVDNGLESFWTTLEPYEWMNEVVSLIKSTKLPWYIATHAREVHHCYSGKVKWIQRYLPDFNLSKLIIVKDKYLLAHENAILIDDNEDNCKKFSEHGGKSFLFPSSLNSGRGAQNARIWLLRYALRQFILEGELVTNEV